MILISEFSALQTETMGMEKAVDLPSALELVVPQLDAAARIVVIPDGGMVLPTLRKVVQPPHQ